MRSHHTPRSRIGTAGNGITAGGATELAAALKANSTLTTLDLRCAFYASLASRADAAARPHVPCALTTHHTRASVLQ